MTNGDYIRSMSDEELALITIKTKKVWLQTQGYHEAMYVCSDGSVTDDWSEAIAHEVQWLRQATEE